MNYYETVSEAITALQGAGYNLDFNLDYDTLHCKENDLRLHPADFHIDEVYRFEGQTDPADAAVVYAISSEKYGEKGVLIDGFGISGGSISPEILEKLKRF
jgi:hypothetical protein